MFFMLSSSFEGLSGGSGGAGVDARPGVTEPVRRREPAVRDGGLLPSAGDEARTEPSPLRRNRFCAVPRLRLPGAEASRRGSPGLGGRVLPPTLPLFRPIVRLPAPPPPKPERVSLWDTRGEASCFVERPTSTRPLDSWS